jgi:two-component system sensor histidine kinase DesK
VTATRAGGLDVDLVLDVPAGIPDVVQLTAYRVVQESLTNVVRHAAADSVVIELGPRGITVTDDGVGPGGPEGNGLRGMRERVSAVGGTLEISGAHPGTRLEVLLP